MRRVTILVIIMTALVAFLALTAMAQEAKEEAKEEVKEEAKEEVQHDFVGAKKCKICHKAQFTSWSETGHATSFDKLTDEEKAKPECVTCHSSGNLAKDSSLMEGIQCEACHGAGGDYKSAKIMSKKKWAADPETYKKMAIDAGLVYPTEEDCKSCHKKEGNPNFKEFDFAKMKGKVHTMSEEGK